MAFYAPILLACGVYYPLVPVKAIIPENLDLQKHYTDYPPAQHIPKFNPDHALYILSQITLVPIRNKTLADSLTDGFVPLYSPLLQKYVHEYAKYLNYFIATGVIETDGKHWTAAYGIHAKSKGYRFVKQYEQVVTISQEYSSRSFRSVLVKKRREQYNELREEYGHLTKWLHPECGLTIDISTALLYLQTRRDAQIRDPSLRDEKKKRNLYSFLNDNHKDPVVQFKYAKATMEVIHSGELGCTVDSNVGRMHTALTNMKSELRHLLRYKEEALVSIDITSSQLYFTVVLFNKHFYTSKMRGGSSLKIEKINTKIHKELSPHTLMLVNLIQSFDNEIINDYKCLVGTVEEETPSSDIYEYMLHQSQDTESPLVDRAAAKTGMFEVLFGKDKRTKVWKRYNQLFPSVSELYQAIKEGNYKRLALLLQSIESHVVLKIVTKTIAKKHPHIPMFTIHDSIAVPVQYEETVRQIMEAELTRVTGLQPRLRMEYWNPKLLDWEKYRAALQS